MRRIIDWIKSSNHYLHIVLLAVLSLVVMSVGAFEFGATGLWTNVWQCVKFGLLTGVVIEAYQAITTKTFNVRNTLGNLVADVIGLVLGVGVYILLALFVPTTAICLYILAFAIFVWALFDKERCGYLIPIFFGCAIVGFSLFIYA